MSYLDVITEWEKIDKEKVDEKIERKYEEIIEHLQSALTSTEEDEGLSRSGMPLTPKAKATRF